MTVEPSKEDPFLTPKEVGQIFSVATYTVRDWLVAGKLKGIKLPTGGWRVQTSEMIRFANEMHGD